MKEGNQSRPMQRVDTIFIQVMVEERAEKESERTEYIRGREQLA